MPENAKKSGFRGPADAGKATQFKPGNPGGPGRPKTHVLTAEAMKALAEPVDPELRKLMAEKGIVLPKKATMMTAFIRASLRRALSKTDAANMIWDRIEGRPLQGIRIEDNEGNAIDMNQGADELKQSILALTDSIRTRLSKPTRAK